MPNTRTLFPCRNHAQSAQFAETQYRCRTDLNLYASPQQESLVTQAARGRYLRVEPRSPDASKTAVQACLCEDDYPGWLSVLDLVYLDTVEVGYQPVCLTEPEIQARLPQVIAFAQTAMAQPNHYLWGGTVGPNYDCSGLMQAAFASVGIWIPRDAYQQEAFSQAIAVTDLQPGDLVFFGSAQKATHVGLWLGGDRYIHSSGKDQGRNGIGIDTLTDHSDRISRTYGSQLRGAGRVVSCYRGN